MRHGVSIGKLTNQRGNMRFATLTITHIVLHQLLKRIDVPIDPEMSDVESPLTGEQRTFIQDKLRETLNSSRAIVEEATLSDVPDLLRGFV